MSDRVKKAEELFKSGYNCSQAVLVAFADKYGLDEKMALRISSSFGGGMGRMREVCGAVSGMFMVAGLENGTTDSTDRDGKKANYDLVVKLADEFKKENGTIYCKELLGLSKKDIGDTKPEERTKEYYKKRPCVELVKQCASILEKELG